MSDLDWYQQMSDRAKAREAARAEAERAQRLRIARDNEPAIPKMAGESDPMTELDEHLGHRVHVDVAHLGLSVCSCGAALGSYSYVMPDDVDPDATCVICDAHREARRAAMDDGNDPTP